MRLLLDTHALLWWIEGDTQRLSVAATEAIASPDSSVFVSAVSGWEVALKFRSGRLSLSDAPDVYLPRHIQINGFETLPIHMSHTLAAGNLPEHHRDPFDRMLVAQAIEEELTLVSADAQIARYSATVLW